MKVIGMLGDGCYEEESNFSPSPTSSPRFRTTCSQEAGGGALERVRWIRYKHATKSQMHQCHRLASRARFL